MQCLTRPYVQPCVPPFWSNGISTLISHEHQQHHHHHQQQAQRGLKIAAAEDPFKLQAAWSSGNERKVPCLQSSNPKQIPLNFFAMVTSRPWSTRIAYTVTVYTTTTTILRAGRAFISGTDGRAPRQTATAHGSRRLLSACNPHPLRAHPVPRGNTNKTKQQHCAELVERRASTNGQASRPAHDCKGLRRLHPILPRYWPGSARLPARPPGRQRGPDCVLKITENAIVRSGSYPNPRTERSEARTPWHARYCGSARP